MPRLIVKKKAEVLKELNLSGEQKYFTIGSEDQNDLVLEDKRVSMTHVKLTRIDNAFFVQDMKSAFGTLLNGAKLSKRQPLNNGDQIKIGEHEILFDNPLDYIGQSSPEITHAAAESAAGEGSATGEITVDASPVTMNESSQSYEQSIGGAGETAPYYLLAIYGPYRGKKFRLRYGETRIGRDNKLNDIVIRENKRGEIDPSISRRHATVQYRDGQFVVSDKRSKTRTFVNQIEIPETGETVLQPGDEIEIVSDQQSTIFRFAEEQSASFAPPKKAGVWSVRYRSKLSTLVAAAAVLSGIFLLTKGWLDRSVIAQKPDPFSVQMTDWGQSADGSSESFGLQSSYGGVNIFQPSPAVSDFNGDGLVDIAMLTSSNNPMLIDGERRRSVWTMTTVQARPAAQLVAADLNKNGLADLLFVSDNGRIFAVDGKIGAEIWMSPFFNGPFTGAPIAADFNGDGNIDAAIAEEHGAVRIGYGDAVNNMEWTLVELGLPVKSALASADLDQDGKSEILSGTDRGLVLIIDGATRQIAGSVDMNTELNKARGSFYGENQIRFPVGVADFNGDKTPDLAMSSVQGNIIVVDGARREGLWEAKLSDGLSLTQDFVFPIALGDLTGDGLSDVVVASESGRLQAFQGSGEGGGAKPLWEHTPNNGAAIMQGMTLADVNKDRLADVIYVDMTGVVKILDGATGKAVWNTAEPLRERTSMPVIADFRGDEKLDVVLTAQSGDIFQFESNSLVPKSTVLWGQRFGGSANTLQATTGLSGAMQAHVMMGLGGFLLIAGIVFPLIARSRRRAA